MKNLIAAAFAIMFVASTAHAEAYPAYTNDKSAWWVSAIFLGPVVALDGVGRAVEVSGKDRGAFQPLHSATGGIIKHAATPGCGLPAVRVICK